MVMMSDVDIEPILDRYMLLIDEYVVVLMLTPINALSRAIAMTAMIMSIISGKDYRVESFVSNYETRA